MENTKTKKKLKLWQRVLIIVLAVIVALVAALGITVGCVWGNEIATVSSFKKIFNRNDEHLDGSVYRMDVKADFTSTNSLKAAERKTILRSSISLRRISRKGLSTLR